MHREVEAACAHINEAQLDHCADLSGLLDRVARGPIDAVVLMADTLDLAAAAAAIDAVAAPTIIACRTLSTEQVVAAMHRGAFSATGFGAALSSSFDKLLYDRRGDLVRPRWTDSERSILKAFVARSPSMQQAVEKVRIAARSAKITAMLHGETGTGKELVAHLIHRLSDRAPHPFIPVDCSAIPEHLVESELFGHERGAFTGAVAERRGRFELANKGTLFLDEVAELPLPAQAKLLRVLEEREVWRVGGARPIPVDLRVISASHKSLSEQVAKSLFRQDLFFRLNVFVIEIPPLRERGADVIHIAEHYLQHFAAELNKEMTGFTNAAHAALMEHPYPGNVRELRNIVERAVVSARSKVIDASDLGLEPPSPITVDDSAAPFALRFGEGALDDLMRQAFRRALHEAKQNRTVAARLLGISRASFISQMKRLGVSAKALRGRPKRG